MADRYFDRMCHHRQHIADIRRTLGIVGAGERETLEAIAAALARAEAAERERNALVHVIQRYQPGGSPPGDVQVLAMWTLDTMQRERDEARAKVERYEMTLRGIVEESRPHHDAGYDSAIAQRIHEVARKALEGSQECKCRAVYAKNPHDRWTDTTKCSLHALAAKAREDK